MDFLKNNSTITAIRYYSPYSIIRFNIYISFLTFYGSVKSICGFPSSLPRSRTLASLTRLKTKFSLAFITKVNSLLKVMDDARSVCLVKSNCRDPARIHKRLKNDISTRRYNSRHSATYLNDNLSFVLKYRLNQFD